MGQKQLPVEASCGPDSAQTPALKPASAEGGGVSAQADTGVRQRGERRGALPQGLRGTQGTVEQGGRSGGAPTYSLLTRTGVGGQN